MKKANLPLIKKPVFVFQSNPLFVKFSLFANFIDILSKKPYYRPVFLTNFANHRRFKMKKLGMIKNLLFAGFICAPLLGYASIPTENNKMNMSAGASIDFKAINLEEKSHFDPQTAQAVKETASLIKRDLEDLGASTIQRIFVLPEEGSLERARVVFVDTARECFIYDSVARETVVCGAEEKVLAREEELLSSSLGFYIDTSSNRALQVAGLGDWICSNKTDIMLYGGVMAVVAGPLIGSVLIAGFITGTAGLVGPAMLPVLAIVATVVAGAVATDNFCPARDKPWWSPSISSSSSSRSSG